MRILKSTTQAVLLATFTLFAVTSCSDAEEDSKFPSELEVTSDEIRSSDGEVILRIDLFPDNIQVDRESEFGAAERFTGAERSPDGRYLAVTTVGVAHSAGWIIEMDSEEPLPAAFQYGGSVEVGIWSDDSRFALFYSETPAPSRVITLTDLNSTGDKVEDNSIPVRLPEHEESVPPNTEYVAIGWDNGELIVEADDVEHRFVPENQ